MVRVPGARRGPWGGRGPAGVRDRGADLLRMRHRRDAAPFRGAARIGRTAPAIRSRTAGEDPESDAPDRPPRLRPGRGARGWNALHAVSVVSSDPIPGSDHFSTRPAAERHPDTDPT